MELTVGVAVAYERLRSSERGRRVGAMVKLCSPPESREKIGNRTTKCGWTTLYTQRQSKYLLLHYRIWNMYSYGDLYRSNGRSLGFGVAAFHYPPTPPCR